MYQLMVMDSNLRINAGTITIIIKTKGLIVPAF
jgi:hypothetical protein